MTMQHRTVSTRSRPIGTNLISGPSSRFAGQPTASLLVNNGTAIGVRRDLGLAPVLGRWLMASPSSQSGSGRLSLVVVETHQASTRALSPSADRGSRGQPAAPRTVPLTENPPITSIVPLVRISYPLEVTCLLIPLERKAWGLTFAETGLTLSPRARTLLATACHLLGEIDAACIQAHHLDGPPLQPNKALVAQCRHLGSSGIGRAHSVSGFCVVAQSPGSDWKPSRA
jgi:hypothetical protein